MAPHAEVAICVTCRSQAVSSDQIMLRGGSTQEALAVLVLGIGSDDTFKMETYFLACSCYYNLCFHKTLDDQKPTARQTPPL